MLAKPRDLDGLVDAILNQMCNGEEAKIVLSKGFGGKMFENCIHLPCEILWRYFRIGIIRARSDDGWNSKLGTGDHINHR